MASLTIELGDDVLERVGRAAERQGMTAAALLGHLLTWRFSDDLRALQEATLARQREDGLLGDISDAEKARAATCTTTHAEVRAMLDQGGGPLLSEIVIEQRGPKL